MIERVGTKKKESVGKFYDRLYAEGGFLSGYTFNKRALDILGLTKKQNAKLLDIACGQGTLLALAEKYTDTYGVDISKEAIKKARRNAPNTTFRVAQAEKLPFQSNYFDYVTCMGSMEHFMDIEKSIKEMIRVSKKGAKILIHVPNSKYLVHMALGIDTQGQINERLATEREWKDILEKYFVIEKTYRYNTRWFLAWIPKRYCCHFTFLCLNK